MGDVKYSLIALALLLRLLVSGLMFHPDIKTISFQTSFLKYGVTDIYSHLINNRANLPLKEEFSYFPFTYFTLGSYQAILSFLLGENFDKWITDPGVNSTVNNPNIIYYLIFLKLPLLFLDFGIAFLLLNYFKDKQNGLKAFKLWLFNPFTIILIYAFSNIDLYVVFLTLVALLFLNKNMYFRSAIFLGLAISFKLYPLLFVPFVFLKAKTLVNKIVSVLVPLSIFVLTIIPFWSVYFVKSALLSGLSTRIFTPNFAIGFGESIILSLFLMSLLFFLAFIGNKEFDILNYILIVLLIVFSFSHFHISWLLWLSPFFIILAINKPSLKWPIFIWTILAISIPLFYSDRAMTISLFRVYSTWFDLLPTPFVFMQKLYDPIAFQSALHSILAGLSTVIAFNLFKKDG